MQERVSREQAELRRRKMELEAAERTKAERERQRAREEEEALDSALKAQQHDTSSSRSQHSQSPQQLTDSQLLAQKEQERRREQQRRRLAAVSWTCTDYHKTVVWLSLNVTILHFQFALFLRIRWQWLDEKCMDCEVEGARP